MTLVHTKRKNVHVKVTFLFSILIHIYMFFENAPFLNYPRNLEESSNHKIRK